MVLTNRAELAERLRAFRHHGLRRPEGELAAAEPWRHEMEHLGYNYRITDFQCALGLRQLEKLGRFLDRRAAIADRYARALEGLGLTSQRFDPKRARHAWHLYVVQLPLERIPIGRRAVFERLRHLGVEVNVHYLPVHLHPFYRRSFSYCPGDYPAAERYYDRALTLPIYPAMTEGEVEVVISAVRSVLECSRSRNGIEAISGTPGGVG